MSIEKWPRPEVQEKMSPQFARIWELMGGEQGLRKTDRRKFRPKEGGKVRGDIIVRYGLWGNFNQIDEEGFRGDSFSVYAQDEWKTYNTYTVYRNRVDSLQPERRSPDAPPHATRAEARKSVSEVQWTEPTIMWDTVFKALEDAEEVEW